jgi:glucose-6-phosphate 1-dehydrogenase
MDFRYAEVFGESLASGYDTLLLDVVQGDSDTFRPMPTRPKPAWQLYTPLLGKPAAAAHPIRPAAWARRDGATVQIATA